MKVPPPVFSTGKPSERNIFRSDFSFGSLTSIVVYHDYICPWCWVGMLHAKRLTEEFGVTFDWRGAELIPPEMEYTPRPKAPVDPNAPPPPPSRFQTFLEEEGFEMKKPGPDFVRSHAALLGAEFARTQGNDAFNAYNEGVYRAFWEEFADISDLDVLAKIAENAGIPADAFTLSIQMERFKENILPFDDLAYAYGIRHVPTFIFGAEDRASEAHYIELKYATERFLVRREKFLKK